MEGFAPSDPSHYPRLHALPNRLLFIEKVIAGVISSFAAFDLFLFLPHCVCCYLQLPVPNPVLPYPVLDSLRQPAHKMYKVNPGVVVT